jgi:hypothetical protein
MGMTREEAITIARYCAKEKPQSYYAEPFQPHEWVIDAILHAAARPVTAAPAWKVVNTCSRCANTHRCPIDCTPPVTAEGAQAGTLTKSRYQLAVEHRTVLAELVRDYDEWCASDDENFGSGNIDAGIEKLRKWLNDPSLDGIPSEHVLEDDAFLRGRPTRPATAAPAERVFCEAIKYSFVCNLRRGHDGDHMDWDASGGCIGWSASTPASREPK